MTRVLIVDDDPAHLRLTAEAVRSAGFAPVTVGGGGDALQALRADPAISVVILDLVMPDLDGMAVLETMRRENLSAPVIVQTAGSSLDSVASAMRQGACDFFVKPVAPERLIVSLTNAARLDRLEAAVRAERSRRAGTFGVGDIVTRAPVMERVRMLTARAARSPIPVLIEGEAGVGKDLVARAIHGTSERAGKPFITVNCATVAPNLLDSVLFGHRKGAFAGALRDQQGKFSEAHGGTLFLDEIGALPPEAQAGLLRAMEHGEIEPLGGRPERVNVRLVSATSRRLLNLAREGTFREDLYYRLNVFPIYVPPLRERPEDIAPLVGHFIARLSAEAGRRVVGISDSALELLGGYDWPGNVRQLENAVYRAVVLSESAFLEPADFPQIVARRGGRADALSLSQAAAAPPAPVHIDLATAARRPPERREAAPDRFVDAGGEVAALADVERDLIAFALRHYGGRMSRVARALGIGRSTLYRKLRDYGLDHGIERHAA